MIHSVEPISNMRMACERPITYSSSPQASTSRRLQNSIHPAQFGLEYARHRDGRARVSDPLFEVRIIVAEREELFDNRQHGQRVHDLLAGPKDYVVMPGISHYDVYGKALEQATKLAIDWYDRHLKGQTP